MESFCECGIQPPGSISHRTSWFIFIIITLVLLLRSIYFLCVTKSQIEITFALFSAVRGISYISVALLLHVSCYLLECSIFHFNPPHLVSLPHHLLHIPPPSGTCFNPTRAVCSRLRVDTSLCPTFYQSALLRTHGIDVKLSGVATGGLDGALPWISRAQGAL